MMLLREILSKLQVLDITLKQRVLDRLTQTSPKWWLFYGVGVGVLLLILLIDAFVKPLALEAQHVFYSYVFYKAAEWRIGTIFLVGVLAGSVLFGIQKRSIWKGLILLFATYCLSIIINLIIVSQVDFNDLMATFEHVETQYSGEYAFNLLRHERWGIDMPVITYNLYQCDRLNISCDLLYHDQIPYGIVALGNDRKYPPRIDMSDDDLLLYVAGDIVYQYMLSPNTPQ